MSSDKVEMSSDGSDFAVDATVDTFDELVKGGHVLIDIWGPDCQPCLRLMPAVHELAKRYADRVQLIKVNAPENRKICRDLRIAGLPAYITMHDGVEVERLTSAATTAEQIEEAIVRLLNGAPAVGPPVPEHLRKVEDLCEAEHLREAEYDPGTRHDASSTQPDEGR